VLVLYCIYICTYVYTHTYIYIYIHACVCVCFVYIYTCKLSRLTHMGRLLFCRPKHTRGVPSYFADQNTREVFLVVTRDGELWMYNGKTGMLSHRTRPTTIVASTTSTFAR
jgi:hypothetical protein